MGFFQTFLSTIKTNHLFFFTVILILFQIVSIALKPYSIDIYSPVTIMTLYSFINEAFTIYQLILASIISTLIPFIICKLFKISLKLNVLILHIILIFSVLTTMSIFKCVFIPALAHSLTSYKMLPQSSFSFLFSYISATFIIILLCMGVFYIMSNLAKDDKNIKDIFSKITNLQQLEKNIKL